MNNNRDYISIEYTAYGYEIYTISDGKRYRLNKQDKIIMYRVLKNFDYIRVSNNVFLYPNYKLISLYFGKEKLKKKFKKVSRGKSKQIVSGVLVVAALVGAFNIVSNGNEDVEKVVENDSIVYSVKDDDDYKLENISNENDVYYDVDIANKSQSYNEIQEDIGYQNMSYNENIEIGAANEFYYDYENPNDKQALSNAENYMDVFSKYERIYGVDANLLCAIGAQESSGIHYTNSVNGGYATGIMGIEYKWANEQVRVFNFDTNCYETLVVDYSRIGELDYNVKIGAAIFQNYFYNTLKNNDSIEEVDYLPFSLQKYNMGPGNMRKVLNYGGNWIDNREMINAGDKEYFEHVLSRLDNDTIIKIRLEDGSYHETKLVNTKLDYNHSRA